MASARVEKLNSQGIFKGSYVLYILRCIRASSSPAFAYAARNANIAKVPVLAVYYYVPDHHNKSQRVFLMEGLKELKASMEGLGTKLLCMKAATYNEVLDCAAKLSDQACEVVIDAAYLRNDRTFESQLTESLVDKSRRLTRIEGNIVVPVALASPSLEMAARTIRPKIWQHVSSMLAENWSDTPKVSCKDYKKLVKCETKEMDIEKELQVCRQDCLSDSGLTGGETAASRMLEYFLSNKLKFYEKSRNVPGSKYQSYLSPYLHFGMISPMDIIRKAKNSSAPKESKDSFVEELLIRRELSHNFVYYAKDNYDSLECLPDWAKKTLREHAKDKRNPCYMYRELEQGRTYDKYWNAAQLEMVHTNKMHGYMRMYWAKKVIEWTETYEMAYKFLIEQNDLHELDGNDPNGFAGVIWNFGMHDRAHAERAIFGKLRYMNSNGLIRKFKNEIGNYVESNYALANRTVEEEETAEPPKKRKKTSK